MVEYRYIGNELEVFTKAFNWKNYLKAHLIPHIGKQVLEVGSGPAINTPYFLHKSVEQWICLEPDGQYIQDIHEKIRAGTLPEVVKPLHGTIEHLPGDASFDTILYLDVLEHIENDRMELQQVVKFLKPNGHLIILAPAFPVLFSNFDRNIGHYRRYTRKSLKAAIPSGFRELTCHYLDFSSIPVSLAARYLFTSGRPTPAQIRIWDSCFVPISRIMDPIVGYSSGKSLIGIWQKNGYAGTAADMA